MLLRDLVRTEIAGENPVDAAAPGADPNGRAVFVGLIFSNGMRSGPSEEFSVSKFLSGKFSLRNARNDSYKITLNEYIVDQKKIKCERYPRHDATP
jgi:hypothetical protein